MNRTLLLQKEGLGSVLFYLLLRKPRGLCAVPPSAYVLDAFLPRG